MTTQDQARPTGQTNKVDLACTNCSRKECIRGLSAEDRARFVGWRLGTNVGGAPVSYCPECTGIDEDYWDDRTLTMAYAAGIDAGNQAWGAA